jgi:uncharacterized protein YegP (UPF0339 family)
VLRILWWGLRFNDTDLRRYLSKRVEEGVLGEMYYFHLYQDAASNWRWRLVSQGNGQTIASSGEAFYSKENAKRAAELVKTVAGSAVIV